MSSPRDGYVKLCDQHQKRCYVSRKWARRVASKIVGPRLNAFPCEETGLWHLGHLPDPVRRGDVGREGIRPGRGVSGV